MSLLSGIRFISKSERESSDSKSKKKDHKSSRHKSKKRSRRDHHERYRGRDGDRDGDRGEEEQEIPDFADFDESVYNNAEKRVRQDDHERDEGQEPSSTALHQTEEIGAHAFQGLGNQDAASMLRARLKQKPSGGTTVPAPSTSSAANDRANMASDLSSFLTPGERKWMSTYQLKTSGEGNVVESGASKNKPLTSEQWDIHRMAAEERLGGSDMDRILASNIIRKGSNFKGTELGLGSLSKGGSGLGTDRAGKDEDPENGAGEIDMRMLQQKEEKLSEAEIAQRMTARADAARKIHTQVVEKCPRCRESYRYQPHRTICSGQYIELRIKPASHALDERWHCELVPISHSPSLLRAIEGDADGEDGKGILRELDRFKSCLVRMFETLDMGVAFMETALHAGIGPEDSAGTRKTSRHHTAIDVVPCERGMEADLEMFFKQAFMTADDDWGTHKKLISIGPNKPLQKAIPSRFAYICAEWTTATSNSDEERRVQGIAHIVENIGKYNNAFCLDVAAGALDLDPFVMRKLKKSANSDYDDVAQNKAREIEVVEAFKREWQMFDWTQYISMT